MSRYTEIKRECFEANLLLPKYGLVDLTFGNVSVHEPELGAFAIKPSGVDYAKLAVDDVVVVDMNGKVVEGRLRPSSDTPTHRRLFQAFPEIRSVVHTHSRHAAVFAQAGKPIPCYGTTHADYFYGEVPVTREMEAEEIQGEYEWETGNVIIEGFAKLDPSRMSAALVRNHGPFIWGSSGRKAVENALVLELIAEMALKSALLNPSAKPIPQALLDRHFLRKHGAQSYYGQSRKLEGSAN